MEESQDNWIPHLEMEEEIFFNESQRFHVQEQVLCNETESHCPYPFSTTIQNNPSNTNIMDETTCNFHMVNTHEDAMENILSTHILPSSIVSSFERGTVQMNHSLKTRTHLNKVRRSSSESASHIASERKRRLKLTQNFIALSAMIPGLKKTEKSYILQEAINYMNQLQERVRELEFQNSAMLSKKLQFSINEDSTICETNFTSYRFSEGLPEVTSRILGKNVLIDIHCEKQNDIVHKIINLVANLHLSITSSSVFPFGASTLIITIIAQMEDGYSMRNDDIVKNLRKMLLESHEVQQ